MSRDKYGLEYWKEKAILYRNCSKRLEKEIYAYKYFVEALIDAYPEIEEYLEEWKKMIRSIDNEQG